MPEQLDNDTLIRIAAGLAAIVAAIIVALAGLYTNLKIKRFELQAQAKKERAAQRLAFHVPLLRFCYELDGRIGRILEKLSSDWMDSAHLERIRHGEGFATDPKERGYFIISTVYVFACFFGWTEAIKERIDATQSLADRGPVRRWLWQMRHQLTDTFHHSRSRVFFFDQDISVVRRLFQYEELFRAYTVTRKFTNPRDACKLHRHLQHSIGEMMLHREDDVLRCKTFREFYEAYRVDETYRYWFVLLEEMFVDLSGFEANKDIETQAEMKNDLRPLRLLAIRYWCRILMRNLSGELGIATPPPDEVLDGRSEALRTTITSVNIEELEAYLAGIATR